MAAGILVPLMLLAMALVAWLGLSARSRAASRAGRVLLFVGFLVTPLLTVAMVTTRSVHESTSREFCLSCHEMTDYQDSLMIDDREYLPAVHYQNHLVPAETACYACHTDYTMYGDVEAKLNGLKHVFVHYLGDVPPPGEIALYAPYPNANCLKCHQGARSFEAVKQHTGKKAGLARLHANEVSCLAGGCHDLGHGITELDSLPRWRPGAVAPAAGDLDADDLFDDPAPAGDAGGDAVDVDDLFDDPPETAPPATETGGAASPDATTGGTDVTE